MQKYPKCVIDAINVMAKADPDYKFIGVMVRSFAKFTFYTILWRDMLFSGKQIKTREFKVNEDGQQMRFSFGEMCREEILNVDELREMVEMFDQDDKEIA